jgi:DNA-binding HxlR family transcriptional regulator
VLLDGPRRFSELVATVPGLSERLLAERLRELERRGILIRRVLPGPPLGVEYELTAAGRELAPAIEVVTAWARKWLEGAPESRPQDLDNSRQVRRASPAAV